MVEEISLGTTYGPFPYGSSLFFDNPRDKDLLYLVENAQFAIKEDYISQKDGLPLDLIYVGMSFLRSMLNAKKCTDVSNFKQFIYLHMIDKNVVDDNFPIEVNILSKKPVIISAIKKVEQTKQLNWNCRITVNGNHVSKKLYHILINLFYFKNNGIYLTDEQKECVKKIHDYQMTWKEFNSIYSKLMWEVNQIK